MDETKRERARRLIDKHQASLDLLGRFERLEAENDRLRAALAAARDVLDCIAINGPGDYLVPMATDALARMHELEEAETSSS